MERGLSPEQMIFSLKPRLDAMRWAFNSLKERSDNLGFYILGLSLTISCVESIKLVLGAGENKVFKIIPIVLSLGVGGLSAYVKKLNINQRLENLLNSINEVTHILLAIRNAPVVTKEIAEEFQKALGIVESSTDPASRGQFYKQASKNLISIQKASLKYKSALEQLESGNGYLDDTATEETDEHPKIINAVIDNTEDGSIFLPPTPKRSIGEVEVVREDENKGESS
jgi:hypothetical protein